MWGDPSRRCARSGGPLQVVLPEGGGGAGAAGPVRPAVMVGRLPLTQGRREGRRVDAAVVALPDFLRWVRVVALGPPVAGRAGDPDVAAGRGRRARLGGPQRPQPEPLPQVDGRDGADPAEPPACRGAELGRRGDLLRGWRLPLIKPQDTSPRFLPGPERTSPNESSPNLGCMGSWRRRSVERCARRGRRGGRDGAGVDR